MVHRDSLGGYRSFQVRNYHGTDVRQKHSFRAYFQARILTILAMIVTLLPYLKIVGGNRYPSSVILMAFLMILYRAWDAVSDLFRDYFNNVSVWILQGRPCSIVIRLVQWSCFFLYLFQNLL